VSRAAPNPFAELAPALCAPLRQAAARLAHDVGKYLSRTARNLPPVLGSQLDRTLLAMLARDLYGPLKSAGGLGSIDRQERPAGRFATLAAPILAHIEDSRLSRAQVLLAELEAIEAPVLAGKTAAVERAAAVAREVDELLRAVARDAALVSDRTRTAP